jgi:hypothetical protein
MYQTTSVLAFNHYCRFAAVGNVTYIICFI